VEHFIREEPKSELLSRCASSLHASSLFGRLFVVRVLLEFSQQTALLKLHIEALERAVDGLIGLYRNVNQIFRASEPCNYSLLASTFATAVGAETKTKSAIPLETVMGLSDSAMTTVTPVPNPRAARRPLMPWRYIT
jgi:hypothetical protein